MNKLRIAAIIVVTMMFTFVMTLVGLGMALNLTGAKIDDAIRFVGVLRLIETKYVNDTDSTKLIDGAISGMVKSLGDPHSIYLDPKIYRMLMERTEGSFGGIGVYMGFKDNKVSVLSVMDDSPAAKAGLKANDEIMAVDGVAVATIQPEEVAMHIRGQIGTDVTLTIHRESETDKDYVIKRDTIQVKTVLGQMVDNGQGYIRISSFSENTPHEFSVAYDKLKSEGLKGLIIDLRENPGGLIDSCVAIANQIVPQGPIVSVINRDGERDEYESELTEPVCPMVVLIDGNSASASEILAGALKDRGVATLVGTKSFGKGSVQMVVPMFHSDAVKLTIAKYYTPSGVSIDGVGIEPDVKVDLVPGEMQDVQLEKAKEILAAKISEEQNTQPAK